VKQGHVQHGEMAFGVLDLALDVLKAFDVGVDKLGSSAWPGPRRTTPSASPSQSACWSAITADIDSICPVLAGRI